MTNSVPCSRGIENLVLAYSYFENPMPVQTTEVRNGKIFKFIELPTKLTKKICEYFAVSLLVLSISVFCLAISPVCLVLFLVLFLVKHLLHFVNCFGLGISELFRIVVLVSASVLSVFTFGKNRTFNDIASKMTHLSNHPLRLLCFRVIKFFNPSYSYPMERNFGSAVTRVIAKPIFGKAESYKKEDNLFKKHVISRAIYTLYPIIATVTRTVDLALGLVGLAFSVVTFNRIEKLNNFAIRNLSFFNVIDDICKGIRYAVNPWQCYSISLGAAK